MRARCSKPKTASRGRCSLATTRARRCCCRDISSVNPACTGTPRRSMCSSTMAMWCCSASVRNGAASRSARFVSSSTPPSTGDNRSERQPDGVPMALRCACVRLALVLVVGRGALAQSPSPADSPIVERVDDTAFLQLRAESFRQLDPRQQALAYWLTQAAIAIDPIAYDQLSQYAVREK